MLDLPSLINNILMEISGKRAWDWVSRISLHHRVQGSPGYHDAAYDIYQELNRIGLDEIMINKYPFDGETATWEWKPSYSWEIKFGELWLVEPKKELLARFDELPTNVVTHSEACDIVAEVIDIGSGDSANDYEGKDLEGKIVLMSGSARGETSKLLHKSGVAGVIIYPGPERAAGYPNMVRYDGFWPNEENRDNIKFGFSINYQQALELKGLLKNSPVKVHAKIDARLFNGNLEVLSAAIKGSDFPEEEILLMAHLCHPASSANDNASGSAGLLELAKSMVTLIKSGLIEHPKRTIRFIWIPEFSGTVPYSFENDEKWKKAIACINLDMIGEDPVQIGYPFHVSSAAYSTPSILNDLIHYFTENIADHPKGIAVNGTVMPMRYRIGPFDGGSDQLISGDSYFGIPSVMFGHMDMFHHTSLDTIKVCDPTEMQRVIGITLCTSYVLSILDKEYLKNLWGIIDKGRYYRLGKTVNLLNQLRIQILNDVNKAEEGEIVVSLDEKIKYGNVLIETTILYEKQIFDSVQNFGSLSNFAKKMMTLTRSELNNWADNQINIWHIFCEVYNLDVKSENQIDYYNSRYERNFDGPVPFSKLSLVSEEKIMKNFASRFSNTFGGSIFELMNLIGLKLRVKTISGLLTLQYEKLIFPIEIYEILELLKNKQVLNSFSQI